MNKLEREHGVRYASLTADAGYERLESYLYLEENGQMSFIKPKDYEQKKKQSFTRQIGRRENMTYLTDEDCYVCAVGRKLHLRRECSEMLYGCTVTMAYYRCESCAGCPCRSACCGAKEPDKPKELRFVRELLEKRAGSQANITTERGVYLRLCRSIQVEGRWPPEERLRLPALHDSGKEECGDGAISALSCV